MTKTRERARDIAGQQRTGDERCRGLKSVEIEATTRATPARKRKAFESLMRIRQKARSRLGRRDLFPPLCNKACEEIGRAHV